MLQNYYDIIIIGAGPAGLMAAIECYSPSRKILILEQMPKPAMKLKISGKGRCNITNDAILSEFISHFGKNGRFLKFAFSEFFNTDLLKFFERLGVHFKLERGGRYFPENDNALEIVKALLNKIKSMNIFISPNSEITEIAKLPDKHFSLKIHKKNFKQNKSGAGIKITANIVVLASGGKSYPQTGSKGAGYKIATSLGHTVTPISPALVPIETKGEDANRLQGLSLRNVRVYIWSGNKKVDGGFGEMVFTDFGLSGPIILFLSKGIVKLLKEKQKVMISIDLKPALDHKMLDQRLLREITNHSKQSFNNLLKKLLPRKLIPLFIEKLKISEKKQLNQINSEERKKLRTLLKNFQLEVIGYKSYDHAIVTSGGISIKEINPQTMESKIIRGLYFAGEIIDIDADTGGFNLQAAFSTGWIAGQAINSALNQTQKKRILDVR